MTLIGHIVGTKGNTGRGIASIVENADYTITINLTDGSSYTTAPIAGFTAVDFDENYDLVVTKTDGTTETVETDIEAFRTVLAGYKSDAETAESNASGYATAASGSASTATAKAKEAESYAKGGTSSRTGEDTDNADYYRGLAAASATAAGTSESNAGTQALKSEGYAVGKQNGTDVSSGSDYYHNNAKYYSDLASTAETNAETAETNASTHATNANADALKAEGYAVGKQNGTTVISGTYYHNNAMYYNSQATNMASLATNKANSAGTDALKAEGFSVGEQNGTPVTSDSDYYENNAKYYAEQAETSAQSLVIEDALDEDSTNAVENGVITKEFAKKANVDGAYENLFVGTSKQIISDSAYIEDNEPYQFRTSGGSADIGDREFDTLVGGSVAWNQHIKNGNFADGKTSWYHATSTTATVSDGVAKVEQTAQYMGLQQVMTDNPLITGHKYLLIADLKADSARSIQLVIGDNTYFTKYKAFNVTTDWAQCCYIDTITSNVGVGDQICGTRDANASGFVPYYVKNVNFIDLTQMFGSTIADYIYTLEQGTAGAGVAFFRKYFPKQYYPYDSGTTKSVEGVSAHKTVGFNAWNEEWEVYDAINGQIRSKTLIPLLPNTQYYIKAPSTIMLYYRLSDGTSGGSGVASNSVITTPNNCVGAWLYTTVGYGTTYKNDICINISDTTKNGTYEPYVEHSYPLDSSLTLRGIPKIANGKLYYDGDTYESDGTVTRNTIYRAYQSGDESLANAITDGTNTVIYSANASTETADPFTNPQIVDDFGTEEYITTSIVPVGHSTKYYTDLVKKIVNLPFDMGMIAPVEKTYKATRNYAIGDYLIVDNKFYKATSAIVANETITPNTNVTQTTISAELIALR